MDLKPILSTAGVHFCHPFRFMSGWVCQWKPVWNPIGDLFKKTYLEDLRHMGGDALSYIGEQCMANIPTMVQGVADNDCTTRQKRFEEELSALRSSWQAGGENDTPTWKLSGT